MADGIRRIAITGASGYLGRLLTDRLSREEDVESILAIDIRPMPVDLPSNAVFVERDITHDISDLLVEHRIDTLAHLAYVIRPDRNEERARRVNVGGAASVLKSCAAAGVSSLLYLSSATAYGAYADNPPQLTEDAPLRPVRGFQYAEEKVGVEALLAEHAASHPEVSVCVLRMCPVLGAGADNFVAESLGLRNLVAVWGYDPPMQFLHSEDAAEIVTRCLIDGVCGTYNLGPRDIIRWRKMADVSGSRLVRIPARLLRGLIGFTWILGLQSRSRACGIELIKHPWVVSGEKLKREHGLSARRSSREAWEAFVSGKGGRQT